MTVTYGCTSLSSEWVNIIVI